MTKLDYSREEAMQILNNANLSDEQKKTEYENYMNSLKKNRKTAIVNKLNEYAKDIPVITKEIYISKLKEYEVDDLSKPFEVIELELSNFEKDMKNKYQEYLDKKKLEEEKQIEEQKKEEEILTQEVKEDDESFDDTIFSEPKLPIKDDDILISDEEVVKPSLLITNEMSVINEETDPSMKPVFDDSSKEYKDVIYNDDVDEKEKGSASAIILSIIAVIIGVVVMYSIIKLN